MNRKMIVATLVIFFLHHLTSSHATEKGGDSSDRSKINAWAPLATRRARHFLKACAISATSTAKTS